MRTSNHSFSRQCNFFTAVKSLRCLRIFKGNIGNGMTDRMTENVGGQSYFYTAFLLHVRKGISAGNRLIFSDDRIKSRQNLRIKAE